MRQKSRLSYLPIWVGLLILCIVSLPKIYSYTEDTSGLSPREAVLSQDKAPVFDAPLSSPPNYDQPEVLPVNISPEAERPNTQTVQKEILTLFALKDSKDKFARLDRAFQKLLSDSQIPRQEKLSVLWELLNKVDGNQRLYVLDNLDALRPFELTPQMIELFRRSNSNEVRLRVLSILREALGVPEDAGLNPDQLDLLAKQSEIAFAFFEEHINSENSEIARYILLELTSLLPEAKQEEILERLSESFSTGDSKAQPVSASELGLMWLDAAVAYPENARFVSSLQQLFISQPTLKKDGEFLDRFFQVAQQLGRDPAQKPSLDRILGELTPDLREGDRYYNWLLARLTLDSSEGDSLDMKLRKYFDGAAPIEKALMIEAARDQLLEKASREEKIRLLDSFIAVLAQKDGDRETREIMVNAALHTAQGLNGQERESYLKSACSFSASSPACDPKNN